MSNHNLFEGEPDKRESSVNAPLTPYQRLLLINQFKILAAFATSEGATEDRKLYARWVTILENGYTAQYAEMCFAMNKEVSPDDCAFVSDVLTMFRALHYYEQDGGAPLTKQRRMKFSGFDGNTEGELRSYAMFLIEQDGMWDEQKSRAKETDGFNSHMPIRDAYGRMLAVFDKYHADAYGKLSTDQWNEVLNAADYSSGVTPRFRLSR